MNTNSSLTETKTDSGLPEPVVQSSRPRCEATHKYVLTDGSEIFARKFMTDQEAKEADDVARRHTAGNVSWILSQYQGEASNLNTQATNTAEFNPKSE